jgi:flagellar hook-basal body complex protein FliE
LESFFDKYFSNHIKPLPDNGLFNRVKRMSEKDILDLVLKDCCHDAIKIKAELIKSNTQDLANRLGYNREITSWQDNDLDKFAQALSEIIYKFRNAIVHSKENDRHIEKIEDDPNLRENFIDFTSVEMHLAQNLINKNIKNW